MIEKPIIWFLSDKKASFNSQKKLAFSLEKSYDIFFLVTFKKGIDLVNINQIDNIENKDHTKSSTNYSSTSYFFKALKKIFNNSPLGILYYLTFIFFHSKKIENLISEVPPKIILLNSDRSGPSIETILLILSKKYKIKIVLPYLSIINSGKAVRIKNPDTFKLNLIGKIFINSKYTFQKDFVSYGFYTVSQYLTLKLLKCLTANPFSNGNNPITSILCLDSKFTFNKISDNIVNPKKVKFIGRVEYDFILKNQNIKKNKILLSLPHLYEHKMLNWENHINFIYNLIEILAKKEKLTISLHPKSNFENYDFLQQKFNCIITKSPIHEEIVKSKLFVCMNSSIAIWSTLIGVKTIILDFFDLDISMFTQLTSISYVNSLSNLKKELNNNKIIDYSNDWKILKKDELSSSTSSTKMNLLLKNLVNDF